jgi:hypothetical protein
MSNDETHQSDQGSAIDGPGEWLTHPTQDDEPGWDGTYTGN